MRFYYDKSPGAVAGGKLGTDNRFAYGVTFEGNVTVLGTLSATQEATAEVITSNSANAFTVGPNGATNPVFNIDGSASNSATGVNIAGAAAGSGVTISATSPNSTDNLILASKGAASVIVASTNANFTVHVSSIFDAASADGLTVGRNGTSNPALKVSTNAGSAATGIQLSAAAAGSNIAMQVISSGTNESLTINGKGTGTTIFQSAVAVPAGGAVGASILMSATANLGIYFGSGAPTVSAAQGSLYIRTDGSSTSTRLYVNTNGSTTWTNVTTAA